MKKAALTILAIVVVLAVLCLGHTLSVQAWKLHIYFLDKIMHAAHWVLDALHYLITS